LYAVNMDDSNQKNNKQPWILYAWILLIILAAILFIVAFPHMREAFRESGMAELIQSHVEAKETENLFATANINFPIPVNSPDNIEFISVSVPVQNLTRHTVVEALLQGPPQEGLIRGAVTYIPANTTLLGITLSYEIAYVDFSREFLEPTVWESTGYKLRHIQLLKTLESNFRVRDAIILVEGAPL